MSATGTGAGPLLNIRRVWLAHLRPGAELHWWCALALTAVCGRVFVASAPSDGALLAADIGLAISALLCLSILLRRRQHPELRFVSFLLGAASGSLATLGCLTRVL